MVLKNNSLNGSSLYGSFTVIILAASIKLVCPRTESFFIMYQYIKIYYLIQVLHIHYSDLLNNEVGTFDTYILPQSGYLLDGF